MTDDTIHTCSYECERPECIRRQRDELRDRMEAVLAQQPASVGEEIMVNAAHDVYTLPLQPSGLDGQGPRFVVHVPQTETQPEARPPKPMECMNGCPDRQVCDHCQWPPGPDRQTAAQQLGHFDRKRFERAPCYLCGYNGPGYYQPDTHPCAAKYHDADSRLERHPDDVAVDRFAAAMKTKLREKRQEGRSGWQSMTAEQLSALLHEHVHKGDPIDVANLAMMLHQNGQVIVHWPEQPAVPPAITHCDNCGCDWLDNGLNPVGCPYCKQTAWCAAFISERTMRYIEGGMAIEQARIHAETDTAFISKQCTNKEAPDND